MRDLIPAFLRHLQSHGKAPRTLKTYEAILASFFDKSSSAPPTPADIEVFLGRARADGRPCATSTRNQALGCLKTFARFAVRLSSWASDPTADIDFVREPPRDVVWLSVAEVRVLLHAAAAASPPALRSRNLAILAVLVTCGLRVHELVRLDEGQVDALSTSIIGAQRKGGAILDAELNAPALLLVGAWLRDRAHLASAGEPALFVGRHGGRMSIRSVQRLMAFLRGPMGTAKRATPHSLRHACGTGILSLGGDLTQAADVLGHASVNTTRDYYLHLANQGRRDAARRLSAMVPAELVAGLGDATPRVDPDASLTKGDDNDPLDADLYLDDAA